MRSHLTSCPQCQPQKEGHHFFHFPERDCCHLLPGLPGGISGAAVSQDISSGLFHWNRGCGVSPLHRNRDDNPAPLPWMTPASIDSLILCQSFRKVPGWDTLCRTQYIYYIHFFFPFLQILCWWSLALKLGSFWKASRILFRADLRLLRLWIGLQFVRSAIPNRILSTFTLGQMQKIILLDSWSLCNNSGSILRESCKDMFFIDETLSHRIALSSIDVFIYSLFSTTFQVLFYVFIIQKINAPPSLFANK